MTAMEGSSSGGESFKIKLKYLKTVDGSFTSGLDSSLRLVNEVRNRFAEAPHIYSEFLNTIDAVVDFSPQNFEEIKNLCVKIVHLFFGHADLIHQFKSFFNDRDEKSQREVERSIGFAIDDRMGEIEVLLCNLRSSIACVEDALRFPPSKLSEFVENKFVGMKLMGIRKLYGEWSEDMIDYLRKDPERALPVLLVRLREKEKLVSMLRSASLQFLRQFHALKSKRDV